VADDGERVAETSPPPVIEEDQRARTVTESVELEDREEDTEATQRAQTTHETQGEFEDYDAEYAIRAEEEEARRAAKGKGRAPRSPSPSLSVSREASREVLSPRNETVCPSIVRSSQKRRREMPSSWEDDEVLDDPSDSEDEEAIGRARKEAVAQRRKVSGPRDETDDNDEEEARNRLERKARKEQEKINERRRQAIAASKDASRSQPGNSRRPILSQSRNAYRQDRNENGRIPWSQKEERLLMEEMEKFPCNWALINDRHGEHGKLSTVLKYRNPVSLKDKAVVIKQRMITNNEPIPRYLAKGLSDLCSCSGFS
jgi:hypothetical protein